MKFKKTLKTLLLSIPLLLGSSSKAEDVYLTPQDNWWNKIEQTTGTKDKPSNVYFDVGAYSDLFHINDRLQVQPYVNLEGIIGTGDLYVVNKEWTPTTGASTVINNAVTFNGDNEVRNIIFEEDFANAGLKAIGNKFNIHDCYFFVTNGIDVYPLQDKETLINNCVFYQCDTAILNALATPGVYGTNSKIENNKFLGCRYGIYTAGTLDIGNEFDKGNNLFNGNKFNIRNESGKLISAIWNYWYDSQGNLLTTEQDIQSTIENINSKGIKGISEVDVIPFYSTDYFEQGNEQQSDVKNWEMYK